MSFFPGDEVRVTTLNKRGVVKKALNNDWYHVVVGGIVLKVSGSHLKADPKKKLKHEKVPVGTPNPFRSRPLPPLDLHGMRVSEALPLVDEHVNRAVLQGAEKVEIIHGIGTGALKHAIHKHLPSLQVVKHFQIDSANPGTTIAYL